jgi:hypothetical protein
MNTILWNNYAIDGTQIYNTGENTQVVYCDMQDTLWPGEGNLNMDPLFIPDDSLYRLTDSGDLSSCLNAGIASIMINGVLYYAPETDYGGNLRPQPENTAPDIGAWESDVVSALEEIKNMPIHNKYILFQNYPNPFNPVTSVEFSIPKPEYVTLKIYNLLGQEITTLVSKKLKAGSFRYEWNATGLASGVYLYKLEAGDDRKIRKMIYIK